MQDQPEAGSTIVAMLEIKKNTLAKVALCLVLAMCHTGALHAQDLSPRAYVITPVHASTINLTWSFFDGGVNFNGTVPITGATGTYNVPIFGLYHSFRLFGRSANLQASLPYAVGNFSGQALGTERSLYRSGLLDTTIRFSVNLKGGPALTAPQYVKWKQKTLLGVSLKVIAPTGQYSPTKLINWGINRWAFKPEFGYSERWGHWILDGYAGIWFYTTNPASFAIPVPEPQTEAPVGSFESHLSYSFRDRGWMSLDGNFWTGGVTTLNGIRNLQSKQTGSRIGCTASVPFSKHQSVKISYSDGTYISFGGNYQNLSVGYQYSWVGKLR